MRTYGAILRVPGVAIVVLASVVARLPMGATSLAVLLYVREETGSFAVAGGCAGAVALGVAVGGPLLGRFVDRRGAGAVVPIAGLAALALLGVWAAGATGLPVGALVGCSLLAGLATPPVTGIVRSRWPLLLQERPALVPSAFALDSVVLEVAFILGPTVTGLLVAISGPQTALAACAACGLAGTTALALSLRDRPAHGRVTAGQKAFGLGALASPGLRALVCVNVPFGFAFGGIEVLLPAFGARHGAPELGGYLLALMAGGSAVGGLVWGARGEHVPAVTAHTRLAWAFPLALAPLAVATSPVAVAVVAVVAGLPLAALASVRSRLVLRVAVPGTAIEAFTWPYTALAVGLSVGSAVTGAMLEGTSWALAVAVTVGVGFFGAALTLPWRHTFASRRASVPAVSE